MLYYRNSRLSAARLIRELIVGKSELINVNRMTGLRLRQLECQL